MKDKSKRIIIIVAGLALSVVLVVMIAGRMQAPQVEDVDIPQEENIAQDVNPQDIEAESIEKEDEIVAEPIEAEVIEQSEITNGDDTGTEQTIQPDVEEKPVYTEEELTNPEQKPNGEKVDVPIEENPNPPQTEGEIAEEPVNPSGGLPGFDNVPNMGANQHTVVDGDGDINEQVGIMD